MKKFIITRNTYKTEVSTILANSKADAHDIAEADNNIVWVGTIPSEVTVNVKEVE